MFFHFDLASPSASVPLSWFPTPPESYGYTDFGAWLIDFELVSCESWLGFNATNVSYYARFRGRLMLIAPYHSHPSSTPPSAATRVAVLSIPRWVPFASEKGISFR